MAVSRNHKRDDSVAAWIGLLRGTVLAAAQPPEIAPARRVGTTGIASVLEIVALIVILTEARSEAHAQHIRPVKDSEKHECSHQLQALFFHERSIARGPLSFDQSESAPHRTEMS